jgi:hypothetical protein
MSITCSRTKGDEELTGLRIARIVAEIRELVSGSFSEQLSPCGIA